MIKLYAYLSTKQKITKFGKSEKWAVVKNFANTSPITKKSKTGLDLEPNAR